MTFVRIGAAVAALLFAGSAAAAQSTASIDTARTRSLAAFATVERVTESPRCQNCHTATAFPRQGDDAHRHRLNVARGADGFGAAALRCTTCHGAANNAASGVPGAPEWHLAPLSMAWEGLSPAGRCRELLDPKRNGHRSGAAVLDHLDTGLVRWAWAPGTDAHGRARRPPDIDYATFIKAARTWIASGARCPRT